MSEDILVSLDGVSKKFCRSLKRSLWYGLKDVGAAIIGRDRSQDELRVNEFWSVKDVSFELKQGECIGLIGPNGAGKSTLLKMLNGLIKPDQGRIEIKGQVGALIELGAGFNPILTGRENIYINGSVMGLSKKQIDAKLDAIVDFSELEKFIDTPVQNYSSGMKVRLGFSVAAQLEPDVLFIDEVLAVGDKGFVVKCMNHLWDMKRAGTSIIMVTHNMYHVNALSDKAVLLNEGYAVHSGIPSEVVNRYDELFHSSRDGESPESYCKELSFKSADIEAMGGNDHVSVMTGQPFKVRINFTVNEKLADTPCIGITFRAKDGVIVSGFLLTKHEVDLPTETGIYSLDVSFARNVLVKGEYEVGLSSFNSEYSRSLGYADRIACLKCETEGYDPLKVVGNAVMERKVELIKH